MLLAACSGGTATDEPTAAPVQADHVRIMVGEDIWPLTGKGPSSKHFAAGEVNVGVYEPLLQLGTDYTVRPGLAERWELVTPTTWRFHLRRGVTFHDGRPFRADDVVWSWSREFLPTAITRSLASVTKVDDHTVDFNLSAPNLRLPEQLVHPEGPIVPHNGHNDSEPPIGTGPYKVVEYVSRQRVVVERFDGYWGEKASVRRLTFRFQPDPESRVAALRAGEVDVVANLPRDAAASVESDGRFRIIKAPPGALHQLVFNPAGAAPFDVTADRTIRQAVALALDRGAYVADVLKGLGEPGRWLTPASILGTAAPSVTPPVHDPARARALLDEAGWRQGADGVRTKDGRRLTVTLVGGPNVPEAGLRLVQTQLAPVGIQVAVKKASDTVTYEEFREKGYDVDLTGPNQNDANPAFLVTARATIPQVDATLTAPTREAVQRVAAEISQVTINEEYRVVPLATIFRVYGLRHGVDLRDPHPSAINQSWVSLAVTP